MGRPPQLSRGGGRFGSGPAEVAPLLTSDALDPSPVDRGGGGPGMGGKGPRGGGIPIGGSMGGTIGGIPGSGNGGGGRTEK